MPRMGALLLAVTLGLGASGTALRAQDHENDLTRQARSKVQPMYPELARKMKISGMVKLAVVVAPNGTVKEAKVLGGHPVLAAAALEAVQKWRFAPAAAESTGTVDFKFEAHQ